MKIYLLRHAQSQANHHQVISCKLPGLGLTPDGIEQIKKISQEIKNIKSITKIYCSPFLRTLETAKYIDLPAPLIIDERIKELDCGDFESVPVEKVESDLKKTMDLIYHGDYQIRFGLTGENQQELISRIYSFLIDIIKKEETVLVVTHGCVVSVVHRLYRKINNLKNKVKSENAKLIEVDFNLSDLDFINNQLSEINNLK